VDGTQPLRVIVVDEQLTFAEAIAARLDVEDDLHVVAALDAVEHLWPLLETGSVDVVLLGLADDAGRDDGRGMAAIRRLAGRDPRIRVVVMASRTESLIVAEAIEARISGWVPKDLGIDRLLETVRGVRQDETWIPAHVLTGVLNVLVQGNHRSTQQASVLNRLTPREMDVLQCIVDGLGRQEMADRLRLSPNTVRTHVQHVLRKLGVHSTLTAAAVARTLGLERRENPLLPTRADTDLLLPGQGRSSLGTSPIT
jgi:DNA-binding NarL/FixJ family response regulator